MKGMEGKLDDSAFVFIIAIALLVIMLVVANLFYPLETVTEANVLTSFQVGLVGSISDEPAVSLNFGNFVVGETQSVIMKSVPRLLIQRGYFGDKSESFNVEAQKEFYTNVKGAKITFTVADTNRYGNLTIKWNGRAVFNSRPARGTVEAQIPESAVEPENIMEIFAEGPGLYFWASTAYSISNLEVDLEYGPDKIIPFEVTPGELQAFSSGKISFARGTENNKLIILINGEPIYQDTPRDVNSAEFTLLTTTVTPGVNVITLSAPDGPVGMRSVTLELFLATNKAVRTRTFEISQETLNVISQGVSKPRLAYTISEARRPGAIQVKLNGQQVPGAISNRGENFIDLPAGAFIQGENIMEFSATGTFVIPEARIELVK